MITIVVLFFCCMKAENIFAHAKVECSHGIGITVCCF